MNILVIFTGGTIGSAESDGYISPNQKQGSALLQMYTEYQSHCRQAAASDTKPNLNTESDLNTKPDFTSDARLVCFDCVSPYTILSENLDGSHIHKLADCIHTHMRKPDKNYDGIIITHGTDTLQYMAAGLYHLFFDCTLPIVLVSSNYVLEDARANGFANFAAAVSFIRQHLGSGVYVAYQNNSTEGELGPVYIHYGNRVLPYGIYSDTLYSVNDTYYCKMLPQTNKEYVSYETYALHDMSVSASVHHSPADYSKLQKNSGILMLYVAPGMYYPEPEAGMKAILLITYHSGTLPTDCADFCHFAMQAHAMGIPVYVLGTQNSSSEDADMSSVDNTQIPYESTSRYEALHLQLLPVMSPVEAYMQLLLS